jgi:hypothetical protein
MIGQRFGRLVVVEFSHRNVRRAAYWKCLCDCSNTSTVLQSSLKVGDTTSCGKHLKRLNIKHGYSPVGRTPTYRSWSSMLTRCTNANASDYKWYGGRGITVCDRWRTFENFLEDMGERPDGKTIDRKNPHGNYNKRNCRWATPAQQRNNQQRSKAR